MTLKTNHSDVFVLSQFAFSKLIEIDAALNAIDEGSDMHDACMRAGSSLLKLLGPIKEERIVPDLKEAIIELDRLGDDDLEIFRDYLAKFGH